MRDHVVRSRFTYRMDYICKGGTKPRCSYLNDECPVAIREIDPAAAPVAYEITSLGPGGRDEVHRIRSFGGSLWWPVADNSGPLKASDFLALTRNDWDAASAILDPLRRTYDLRRPSTDEFFNNTSISKKGCSSTRVERSNGAERDASRMIFCEGRVLVEAGDPVWYAVSDDETRDGFGLFIGHSALDRRNGAGYSTPGPDRGVRLTSARLARAFGLSEIEARLCSLRARRIRYKSEITATQNRATGPAAELCARAWAHYLWEIAWRYPDLRKAMPAVADAAHPNPPPEALPHRQMLEQLVSIQDSNLEKRLSFLITDAHQILERLRALEGLAEEDDAALARLFA
jgi:hypothetical protein